MATTSSPKPKKVSFSSLLSLALSLIPIILEHFNSGSDVIVELHHNPQTQKLNAKVAGVKNDVVGTGKKVSVTNK